MSLNKNIINAVVLAMAALPGAALAATQVAAPITSALTTITTSVPAVGTAARGTAQSGATGPQGPVNLTVAGNRTALPNTFSTVKGTTTYMSELRAGNTSFDDRAGDSLDFQTLTGAGVAANNQAAFRYDVIGGGFGLQAVTSNDLSITQVGTGLAATLAKVNANLGMAGLLAAANLATSAFAPVLTVLDATSTTTAQAAVIKTSPNSAASKAAVIAAVKASFAANATALKVAAPDVTAMNTAIDTWYATNITITSFHDAVLNNFNNPGFVTVLQGGQVKSTSVIFQVDLTKLVDAAGKVLVSNSRLNLTQTDRVDFAVNGITATAVAGAPIKVDYEYYMYAGGNGAATAIQNNRAASLAGYTAVAINTSAGITSTLVANATPAVIDVAQVSKRFLPTTRQVLKGDAGLQVGSLGSATLQGLPAAGTAILDGRNSVPTVANVGSGNAYPGVGVGAAGTTAVGVAQYTGVSTNISRGVNGAYNNSVVGAIITQTIPGDPSIGDVTVTHNNRLNFAGAVYSNAKATTLVDKVDLTVTSVDPAGLAAFSAGTSNGFVYLDVNKNSIRDAGDISAATTTANSATFFNVPVNTFAGNANIPVRLQEDKATIILPTKFNASVQYKFGNQVTYQNPAVVASAFGSDVRNGSTRVADSVPASNNLTKTGFIRITNRGNQAGKVTVQVFDNAGKVIVPAGTVLVPSLAPNVTYVLGGGGRGGAGKEIDLLAGALPGVASFTARARVVITGEFSNMDVQSLVQSAAGSAVQTNLSAHAGK